MKKLAATLCIVGTALTLAACESTNNGTYDSGSSYANERTAGNVDAAPVRNERVFRSTQSK